MLCKFLLYSKVTQLCVFFFSWCVFFLNFYNVVLGHTTMWINHNHTYFAPLSFLSVRLSHRETSKVDASSILGSPWYCGNPSQYLIRTGVHKAQGSFISLLTWVRAQWNTNKALAERNRASRFWQEMMNNGRFFRCLRPYLWTFPLSLGWIGAAAERCLLFSSSLLDSDFSGSC